LKEIQTILRDISEGKIANNYFLMGYQPYFINLVCKKLEEKLKKVNEEFDLRVLYGKETSIKEILETVKSYSMFGNKKLVIIKEAQYLSKQISSLIPYLENSLNQTVLVICFVNKVIDKKVKLYKFLFNNTKLIEFRQLYEADVLKWINSEVKKFNLNIDPKAAVLMTSNIGLDLEMIEKAIKKLSMRNDIKDLITVDEIEKYIGLSKDYNNFELQNAIGEKKYERAIFIVNQMQKNKSKKPISLTLSVLNNFFQKIIMIHSKSLKIDPKDIGIHPYFFKDYQKAARNFSLQSSVEIIHLLKQTDLKSKGIYNSRINEKELMLDLILDIIRV
tara:strand:+ start:149 stop:1144 length:996 start_codon:yes stop_codon:yes gene_type:complete